MRHRRVHPATFRLAEELALFPDWYSAWNTSPITQERPWITYRAIDLLEKYLTREMRVCEYGVGGSTLFFASRVKELVSIEHDGTWATEVTAKMKQKKQVDWELIVAPPESRPGAMPTDLVNPDNYASSRPEYTGMTFEKYATSIDRFPDGSFDLVQVDGRVRPSCAKRALAKVKKGGFLVVDDTHRAHYTWGHEHINGVQWEKHDCFGPGPYEWEFRQTFGWRKLA